MPGESSEILCLGVESTAHTFGVALATSKGEILSDVNATYRPPPARGIHPREAAQHHSEHAPEVLQTCLREAGIDVEQIDAVAFSMGPGLGPALRTGATVARALAVWLNRPLVPVHHAIAHIEIASLTTGAEDPLVVLVSGGHTTIAAFAAKRWRVFGETEDITLGNLLDMFGREAGLPSPGGPAVEELAMRGENFIDLPYVVKGNDVSYSGLLTAAVNRLKEGGSLEDLCYSLQEVSFAMLAEASERALAHTERKEVLLAGGVAANERLRQMIRIISEEHDARFFVVPRRYSGDCGAQIAWTGVLAYMSGVRIGVGESFVRPRWRLDRVDVPWR
ncbi:MAG: KEOPS complex N(6)-L-threonylcarbamoyladenine synthase Kae1 [Candidatus Bathyarchaeia archaeon]